MDETADAAIVDRRLDVDLSSGTSDVSSSRFQGLPWFARSLRELAARQTVDETLQFAVDLAAELVAGCEIADVMFWQAGHTNTPVSSDARAITLDEAQAAAGHGPCLEAAAGEPVVIANDLARDERFPIFGPKAEELGARSALSYQLVVDRDHGARLGALNLYGTDVGAFEDDAIALGAVLATHCATVLTAAVARQGLEAVLETRDIVGQAKGILMERHRLTATDAFELLRSASQDHNIKLPEIARWVVETGQLPE